MQMLGVKLHSGLVSLKTVIMYWKQVLSCHKAWIGLTEPSQTLSLFLWIITSMLQALSMASVPSHAGKSLLVLFLTCVV